jgi:hypothetical protein
VTLPQYIFDGTFVTFSVNLAKLGANNNDCVTMAHAALALRMKAVLLSVLILSYPDMTTCREDESVSILRDALMPAHSPHFHPGRHQKRTMHYEGERVIEEPKLCFAFDNYPHGMMLTTSTFMPDLSEAGYCFDNESEEFQTHLKELANPAQCLVDKQLTTDNVGYGLGSVINSWTKVDVVSATSLMISLSLSVSHFSIYTFDFVSGVTILKMTSTLSPFHTHPHSLSCLQYRNNLVSGVLLLGVTMMVKDEGEGIDVILIPCLVSSSRYRGVRLKADLLGRSQAVQGAKSQGGDAYLK